MAKYQLTKKAVEDLGNIWEYTVDRWSEEQADSYYRMLLEICGKIANQPDLGRNYEGIKADLFGLKVGRYITFYRKMPDKPIEITRIFT